MILWSDTIPQFLRLIDHKAGKLTDAARVADTVPFVSGSVSARTVFDNPRFTRIVRNKD